MAKYSLSELIFKTNELTQIKSRLCPKCLVDNVLENSICTTCKEEIPNYTEETFLYERAKHIAENVTDSIGIGDRAEAFKKFKADFETQNELWQSVVQVAEFLNQFTMHYLDPKDFARRFLRNFPLGHYHIEKLQLMKIDFNLKSYQCSEIREKLVEIERKEFSEYFRDVASWISVMFEDQYRPSVIENLKWMNINSGYYYNRQGAQVSLDETNQAALNLAIDNIPTLDSQDFSIEVMLFPLHWKYVILNRLYPKGEFRYSKMRYKVIIDQWIPTTRRQQAWKALGQYHCDANTSKTIAPEATAYFEAQAQLPIEEKDQNFFLSYIAITETRKDLLSSHPRFTDSYFAPMLNLVEDESFLENYFLSQNNKESFLRALFYVDFSRLGQAKKIAQKFLSICNDDEIRSQIPLVHPSLYSHLILLAVESNNEKQFNLLVSLVPDKNTFYSALELGPVVKGSPAIARKLLERSLYEFKWPPEALENIFQIETQDLELLKIAYRHLEEYHPKKDEILGLFFDLWIKSKDASFEKLSEFYLDRFGQLLKTRNPFERRIEASLLGIRQKISAQLFSKNLDQRERMLELIQAHVSSSGTDFEVLLQDFSSETILESLIWTMNESRLNQAKQFAYSLISSALQKDLLSQEQMQILSKECVNFDSEFQSQISYKLREKIKLESDKQKPSEDVLELKKKLADAEKESMLQQQRQQKEQESRDKNAQFQIKLTEVKAWFQIEMMKATMTLTNPEEQSKRMNELSDEYAKKLEEITKLLN